MINLAIDPPNEKQKLLLKARKKYIGYGGARGGGKSWGIRTKAILAGLRYPGITMVIVRKTYPELLNNHINIMRAQTAGFAKYNEKERTLKFANGSKIIFQYCATDADLDNFQGQEFDLIFIDEATQLSEFQLDQIKATLRGVNDFPKRIYYTCNPGGKGHDYIKRLFITKKYKTGENPDDYEFIQSLVTDNVALMKKQPDYIEQLRSLPPKLRDAWLHGSWDLFEGQVFEDFVDNPEGYETRQHTHVINPFKIPKDWEIYRSFDFGFAKPFSVGWWAVDYQGVLYRFMEMYGVAREPDGTVRPDEGIKWEPDRIFSEIHRIENDHPLLKGRSIYGPADPSIWDKSRGKSIYDTSVENYVMWTPGDNHRISGWMQLHYRLRFDEGGYPMMYVFKNCTEFIRTIPLLEYSKTRPEDVDTTQEDHIADETRYMCMSRPLSPQKKEETDEASVLIDDPLDMMKRR